MNSAYAFFSATAVVFFVRAGRNLPKLPIDIFPRLVRLSPLPINNVFKPVLIKMQK
jgi:hypothetical protein